MIGHASSYLRRAMSSQNPKPLLLVGSKGSGKTSIAKLVAERLEVDREVLTGKCPCLDS